MTTLFNYSTIRAPFQYNDFGSAKAEQRRRPSRGGVGTRSVPGGSPGYFIRYVFYNSFASFFWTCIVGRYISNIGALSLSKTNQNYYRVTHGRRTDFK